MSERESVRYALAANRPDVETCASLEAIEGPSTFAGRLKAGMAKANGAGR
jgi:hypothetical protein